MSLIQSRYADSDLSASMRRKWEEMPRELLTQITSYLLATELTVLLAAAPKYLATILESRGVSKLLWMSYLEEGESWHESVVHPSWRKYEGPRKRLPPSFERLLSITTVEFSTLWMPGLVELIPTFTMLVAWGPTLTRLHLTSPTLLTLLIRPELHEKATKSHIIYPTKTELSLSNLLSNLSVETPANAPAVNPWIPFASLMPQLQHIYLKYMNLELSLSVEESIDVLRMLYQGMPQTLQSFACNFCAGFHADLLRDLPPNLLHLTAFNSVSSSFMSYNYTTRDSLTLEMSKLLPPHLTSLDCGKLTIASEALVHLKSLEFLKLSVLSAQDLRHLPPSLQFLHFTRTNDGSSPIDFFHTLPRSLRKLQIEQSEKLKDMSLLSTLPQGLTSLHCNFSEIPSKVSSSLPVFPPSLTEFVVSSSLEFSHKILECFPPTMTRISTRYNDKGPSFVGSYGPMPFFQSKILRHLSLDIRFLLDEHSWQHLPAISHLILPNCAITEQGLLTVPSIEHLEVDTFDLDGRFFKDCHPLYDNLSTYQGIARAFRQWTRIHVPALRNNNRFFRFVDPVYIPPKCQLWKTRKGLSKIPASMLDRSMQNIYVSKPYQVKYADIPALPSTLTTFKGIVVNFDASSALKMMKKFSQSSRRFMFPHSFVQMLQEEHLNAKQAHARVDLTDECLSFLPRSLTHLHLQENMPLVTSQGLNLIPSASLTTLKILNPELARRLYPLLPKFRNLIILVTYIALELANFGFDLIPASVTSLDLKADVQANRNTFAGSAVAHLPRNLSILRLRQRCSFDTAGVDALPQTLIRLQLTGPSFGLRHIQHLPLSLTHLKLDQNYNHTAIMREFLERRRRSQPNFGSLQSINTPGSSHLETVLKLGHI